MKSAAKSVYLLLREQKVEGENWAQKMKARFRTRERESIGLGIRRPVCRSDKRERERERGKRV